jgi:two-component system chemotaxis sensor kinase CheA
MDDLTKEFLVESYEILDRMDRDFVELEKNPSKEVLGSIFRAIHTIKGTCGFLGYGKLEAVTHAGENLLSRLRDGSFEPNQPITDALLAMIDAVRQILGFIELYESEGERDDSELIETLNALQKSDSAEARELEAVSAVPDTTTADKPEAVRLTLEDIDRALEQQAKGDSRLLGEILVHEGKARAEDVQRALKLQAEGDPRQLGDILMQPGGEMPGEPAEALQNETKPAVSDRTIRVDVSILDKLMNLVGELVLARNQIMQFAADHEDSTFVASSQHLNLVTSALQEGVMKTRMQPIRNVWGKFPRVVRDLAASCKKQVRVEMEGAETELDRTIIEAIKDPLTHVVRNSVDHGIESPAIRLAAGKAPEGRVLLRAYHEGGQVNIEISDDGAGIDPEQIRDKALQKKLITLDQLAKIGEREMINLIFLPGLTTTEKVSSISGRGVGMDVVRTNIEKIGGTVDVHSELGQGTTIKIKIPLTLAIIPALMVSSGGERYAIPQASLSELVRLDHAQARPGVEMVHDAPVYRLRGTLLPLVFLNGVLKLGEPEAGVDQTINIVVLQADGKQFGLVVDAINDSKDIVVKPLGKHLKGLTAFAGATILGDGAVALILDVVGISQCVNFVAGARQRPHVIGAVAAPKSTAARQALLICRYGGQRRVAIPLALVARLEKFDVAAVETSRGQEVIQYHGEILPLICLSDALGGEPKEASTGERPAVVVVGEDGRSVGMLVDQIVDIVEADGRVQNDSRGGYFTASAVVQGRITDVLDVCAVMESVGQTYSKRSAAA